MLKPAPPDFDEEFRKRFSDLIAWRRDVRRFKSDPVDDKVLHECLELTHMAPSVGLSQPWRFIELADAPRRRIIVSSFEKCNADALADYSGGDKLNYARLKLEGLREAPVQLAVFADTTTAKGKGLGRKTMPEMITYSVVTAIHTFWLATRAHGLGMGWVSILKPQDVARACQTPSHWQFVAYLCVGWPQSESLTPELETSGWENRAGLSGFYKKL